MYPSNSSALVVGERVSKPADGHVPMGAVINKLREWKFSFRRQCDRTNMWRNGAQRVFVPMKDLIPCAWVRSQFRQLDMPEAEIEAFIGSSRV